MKATFHIYDRTSDSFKLITLIPGQTFSLRGTEEHGFWCDEYAFDGQHITKTNTSWGHNDDGPYEYEDRFVSELSDTVPYIMRGERYDIPAWVAVEEVQHATR